MNLEIGKNYYGFEVVESGDIKQVGVKYWRLVHKASGASLIYTDRDDGQLVFSAGFRTLPEDDTGVFHILEHSCLDGSENYRLKEPFVNIICSSLAVDLNAVTYPDKTIYYYISTNEKDYMNLMSVYLDAVFHPLLLTDRRIFEKEAWHLEPDSNGGVVYNGVVFNEMQGHENMPDSILEHALEASLFPNNCYAKDSGGRPTAIPELTYEQFCETYKRFYSTENCTIYMSGKMSLSEQLEYIDGVLCGVPKYGYDTPAPIAAHHPVVAPDVRVAYQLPEGDSPTMNTKLALACVLGNGEDGADILGMKILSDYMAQTPTSPLSKAVLDANIGQDFSMFCEGYYRQPAVIFMLGKSEEKNAEKFKDTVLKALSDFIRNGLDRARLDDLLDNNEIDSRRQSLSVRTGYALMESMLRDMTQFGYIRSDDALEALRAKLSSDGKYFEHLIEKYILDSKHWTLVRCVPSNTVMDEKKAYMKAKLDAEADKLNASEGAYEALCEHIRAFKEYLGAPDSSAAVASIPHLALSDISRENRLRDMTESRAALKNGKEITSLLYGGSSLGIIVAGFVFDLKKISADDLFYASCLSRALFSLPTDKHTAPELNDMWVKLKAKTDAVTHSHHISGGAGVLLDVNLNMPVESITAAATLLEECLTSVSFDREIITRLFSNSSSVKDEMIWGGSQTAANYASRCLNLADAYRDKLSGVSFYQRLKSVSDSISDKDGEYDENVDTLIAGMERVYGILFGSGDPVAYFIGDDKYYSEWTNCLSNIDICDGNAADDADFEIPIAADRALAISGDVNYCAKVYDAKSAGYTVTNRYLPVCRYIYGKYMWDEVRAKGGAYGAGVNVTRFGLVKLYSYRDPRVKETYDVFAELPAWLENNIPSRDEIEKNIISCASNACFEPMSILDEGKGALSRYLRSKTAEETWSLVTEIFDTTEQDFRDFAQMLRGLDEMRAGVSSTLGNRARMEDSALFKEITEL
ncbi:MAG: hypothetical protein E7589_00630 [Ruminococcaceae bacterium]|nr:hypothetical protein [Oscillospiraceae bacterium]